MATMILYRCGLAACFLIVLSCAQVDDWPLRDEINLCEKRPGYEPNGEHLPDPGDSIIVYVNWTITDPNVAHHCLMRFSTCESCRLHVTAEENFYYRQCPSPEESKDYRGWCVPGCTYIHLYDQYYSNRTSASYTSSGSGTSRLDFLSESKYLYMIGCSNKSTNTEVSIRLNVTAEEKIQYFSPTTTGNSQALTSPFFPDEYVLNSEEYKFIFQAATQDEFITISFDDWQLSEYSSILFDSANIRGQIWGTNQRPWIISDGYKLMMTFDTGPYRIPGTLRASKGFKAIYEFHSEVRDDVPYVHTNCGWWVENQESGTVSFNPAANGYDYNDCIWIIKKHPKFEKVLVKVLNYSTRGTTYHHNQLPNTLEIRKGVTSLGPLVESTYPSSSQYDRRAFLDHESDVGFYVRIKGHYSGQRDFFLAYTSFNVYDCRDLFRCRNDRCVHSSVKCNLIDNCGDNSDESDSVCGNSSSASGSRSSSPISVGIIIPMVVSIFLIVVICLLVIFIRRCRRLSCQTRRAQRRQQHINTVSGTVSRHQRRHNRRRGEHRREEGGQVHDPPPSYEDVLNNTPIGYLNLGFSDARYSASDPVQPPSYDEAISPNATNAAFTFQSDGSHDLSSDSSSLETTNRSLLNTSTSCSSDDTQRRGNQRRHRDRDVLSSSDSSNDGSLLNETGNTQRGEGSGTNSHGDRGENLHPEVELANTRRSIVKPEDSHIELPISSSTDIVHNKNKSNKSPNVRENESDNSEIVSEGLPPGGLSPNPDSGERVVQPVSVITMERSPIISAPSLLSLPHQGQSASESGREDMEMQFAEVAGGASSRSQSIVDSNQQALRRQYMDEDPSVTHENESSTIRQVYNGRPSPSKHIPAHIRKAKNSSAHALMKHLSRSMDDLGRHTEVDRADQLVQLPSRQFSRSVQNISEDLDGRVQRDPGNCPANLQRSQVHYQSQPLSVPQAGASELNESPQRGNRDQCGNRRQERENWDHSQPDSQLDRPRADRHQLNGRPEPQPRRTKPQVLPRERSSGQSEKGSAHPVGRPKPQPRQRSVHLPGERTNSDPHRSEYEGRQGKQSELRRSPQRCDPRYDNAQQSSRDRQLPPPYSQSLDRQRVNPDLERNQNRPYPQRSAHSLDRTGEHAGRMYPVGSREHERQSVTDNGGRGGHLPIRPDRPSEPPKSERSSRPDSNKGDEHRSPTRGPDSNHPYRTPGPPQNRPFNPSRHHRPTDLYSPAGHSNQRAKAPDHYDASLQKDLHGGRHEGRRQHDTKRSGPAAPCPESPHHSPVSSPHSPMPRSPLSNVNSHFSPVPDSLSDGAVEAKRSPTQRSPLNSTPDFRHSADFVASGHPGLSGGASGPRLNTDMDSKLNTNAEAGSGGVTSVGAFSPVRFLPSSHNLGTATILSLRTDGEEEEEDIYV